MRQIWHLGNTNLVKRPVSHILLVDHSFVHQLVRCSDTLTGVADRSPLSDLWIVFDRSLVCLSEHRMSFVLYKQNAPTTIISMMDQKTVLLFQHFTHLCFLFFKYISGATNRTSQDTQV